MDDELDYGAHPYEFVQPVIKLRIKQVGSQSLTRELQGSLYAEESNSSTHSGTACPKKHGGPHVYSGSLGVGQDEGVQRGGVRVRTSCCLSAALDFFEDAPVEELRGDQEEIFNKLCDWDANKTFDKLDAWRMLEPPDEMDEETTKLLDDLRSVYDTMVSNAAWHIRDDGLKKDFATYLVAVSSWPGEASKANEHYMESIRNFIILMDIAFKLGELGQEQLWRSPPKNTKLERRHQKHVMCGLRF